MKKDTPKQTLTDKEYGKQYRHSKKGVAHNAYGNQTLSSKRKGRSMPTYTSQELYEWLMSQPKFHVLYDNWKRLDYQKMRKPSVDRKKDDIGYTLANIQLMTWAENKAKGHKAIRENKIKHDALLNGGHRAVRQYSKENVFIAEYISLAQAFRQTGVSHPQISNCCQKRKGYKTAGGYKWEYVEEERDV